MKPSLASAVLSFVLPTFAIAQGGAAGIADHLTFGDAASESAHAVKPGGSPVVVLDTEVGVLKRQYTARKVAGKGASLDFMVQIPPDQLTAGPVTLEFREIHNRQKDVFGYSISAGGKEVYFRNYEEVGAGPNHFFVEVARSLVPPDGRLPVAIRSESAAPFHLADVWVYPDFKGLVDEENISKKMGVVVGASAELAGIPADTKAPGDALKIAEKLKELYGGMECYEPGLMTSVPYARRSAEECRKGIDQALDVSLATGMPYHFMFSSWWGTSAIGPDHLGGYFSDLQYEQITYNELTKSYQASFPNNWGNTMWPTKNHPHLNRCNNYRIELMARYLADRQAELLAAGARLPVPAIYAEMGPSYGADYNPATREAALKDGVTLAPEDGLSNEEARWVHKNYAAYFAQQVPFYRAGLGRGDIIVNEKETAAPIDPLFDNIFTHGFWGVSAPLYDPKFAYWQCNLNDGMWCSGELYESYPQAYYDYVLPISRLTCVNLERPMVKDLRFLKAAYGNGLAFVTLFNALPGDEKFVREVDRIDQEPKPPVTYRRRVLDIIYARDKSMESGNGYVAGNNVRSDRNKIFPAASGKPGRVVYRVSDPETAFEQGLFLELNGTGGRPGRADGITVSAGTDEKSLQKVPAMGDPKSKDSGGRYDLSQIAKGNKDILVAIEMLSSGQPEEVHLKEVAAFVPWPKPTGQADGSVPNLGQSRLRSLWLQQRARLDRVEADVRDRNASADLIKRGSELREKGRYATAWRLLTEEDARLLPARYTIRGKGRLEPYPIGVEFSNADAVAQMELLSVGADGAKFRVNVSTAQQMKFTVGGLKDGMAYRLESKDDGFVLQAAAAGGPDAVIAQKGEVALDVNCKPAAPNPELPIPPDEIVQLPRKGKGKMESETGVIKSFAPPSLQGKICNGIVELESGNRYELGYTPWWTQCDLVSANGLKSLGIDGIKQAFKPGQPVTIEYEPVAFKGHPPRINKASQPTKILFQEDYTKAGGDWAARALEVNGMQVADYRGKKLYPVKNWSPGSVVYRITGERPLGPTAVGFTGRLIITPENRATFSVRTDGGEWKRCGEFVTASPGANDPRGVKFVDLTDFVQGRKSFDLKVELMTTNSTWASLYSLQVRTLDLDKVSPQTEHKL
jgi:hypothetical protein